MSSRELRELAAVLKKAGVLLGAAGSLLGLMVWLRSQAGGRR